MANRFAATKEKAAEALATLRRAHHCLSSSDYDQLFTFIQASVARLPRHESVARDLARRESKRVQGTGQQ
jgi:hypothetical protein